MSMKKPVYLMESAPDARTVINGREVDYFCGTGYFGLHGHPELIRAACEAVKKYGIGSATSRSGYGYNPVLSEVEKRASEFFGTQNSLYYVSGYLGNTILLKGIRDQFDLIFVDKDSHYSVLDAAFITNKPVIVFAHLDPADLRKKLRKHIRPSQRPLLICDGVFPISGEISPLPEYIKELQEFDRSILCIDDAHAVAVIGKEGRGSLEYFGIKGERHYFSGTFSKAVGGHGGIIPGEKGFIEKLKKETGIPYGASSVPTAAAAATARALEMITGKNEIRKKLWSNVFYVKKAFRELGFDINDNPVPIICLALKKMHMQTFQAKLFQEGIAVHYMPGGSYSNLPSGGAIRIAVFSTHTQEQLDRLVGTINKYI